LTCLFADKSTDSMEIGKRYVYGDDTRTYTGDLVSVNERMITMENRSCETYKNCGGRFSTERNLILWMFPLEHLVEGTRYSFTLNNENGMCEGVLVSITGRHDTVRCKNDNGVNTFSIYCVKNIEIVT
jgi:hypothetical protein